MLTRRDFARLAAAAGVSASLAGRARAESQGNVTVHPLLSDVLPLLRRSEHVAQYSRADLHRRRVDGRPKCPQNSGFIWR